MKCFKCGADNLDGASACAKCGSSLIKTEHKMKWYKLLVFFGLPASAALYFFMSFSRLTGLNYTYSYNGNTVKGAEARDIILGMAPGLKTAEIFNGITYLILGLITITVWILLLKKKKIAPVSFYIFYGLSIVLSIVSLIMSLGVKPGNNIILSGSADSLKFGAIVSAVIGAVMLVLNIVYFNKRKDVFVN